MRGMRARRLERTFMWEGGQLQARRPRKPLLLFNKSTVFDEQYRSSDGHNFDSESLLDSTYRTPHIEQNYLANLTRDHVVQCKR